MTKKPLKVNPETEHSVVAPVLPAPVTLHVAHSGRVFVKTNDGRYCPIESSRLDLSSKQWNEYENLHELRGMGVQVKKVQDALLYWGLFLGGVAMAMFLMLLSHVAK